MCVIFWRLHISFGPFSCLFLPESMLIMSFVISTCWWLCGYGWQLLMKSIPPHTHYLPPHKSELTFKPCHTLPLMSSAQSEAAVTFWSLRFSIPFSTGALQENNLMLVAPAIDISNSGFRSYFSGSGYPFLPSQLNVSHLGQDQICMRGWSTSRTFLLRL